MKIRVLCFCLLLSFKIYSQGNTTVNYNYKMLNKLDSLEFVKLFKNNLLVDSKIEGIIDTLFKHLNIYSDTKDIKKIEYIITTSDGYVTTKLQSSVSEIMVSDPKLIVYTYSSKSFRKLNLFINNNMDEISQKSKSNFRIFLKNEILNCTNKDYKAFLNSILIQFKQ